MTARPPILAEETTAWAGGEPMPAAPDAWYFPAAGHEEAVARMLYLVEHYRPGGLLTGESGVGKSMLLRAVAAECEELRRTVVPVDLTAASADDVLRRALLGCGLVSNDGESSVEVERRLTGYLRGCQLSERPVVVLADHADRAAVGAAEGLERLMRLTDARLGGVTLILASTTGVPVAMSSVAARWCELKISVPGVTRDELPGYLAGAVEDAGSGVEFDDAAADRLHAVSNGVPRLIDRAARLAVLSAYADGLPAVAASTIDGVLAEMPVTPAAA